MADRRVDNQRNNRTNTSNRREPTSRAGGGQRPSVRTSGGSRPAGKSGAGLMGVLAGAVAVLVVAVGVSFALTGPFSSSHSSSGAPASLPAAAAAGSTASANQKADNEGAADGNAGSQQSDTGAAAESGLSARDEAFAVDPDKTKWSFSDNGRKVVYLTIDDGPSDKTQQVLDILDKYGCKATFFVTGQDPDNYHMIKEAYDRGHTIGLHTMTHDYDQIYASTGAYFDDLDQIGQIVKDQIGFVPCFIRFPGGSSNSMAPAGMMDTLESEVQAKGYQYYDWNVSTGDGSEHTADELYGYATEGNPPGTYETNIVMLCHDSAPKQTTVDALPRIIEYYQGMGYSFEAIGRDTWVCHHG